VNDLEPSARLHGILQADGYAGSIALRGWQHSGGRLLAHVRRKFYDIHQAIDSPIALEAMHRIGALYAIEAEIRGKPAGERQAVRQSERRYSMTCASG